MKQKPTILKIIVLIVCILLVLIAGVYPLSGGRVLGGRAYPGIRTGDFTPPAEGSFQPGQGGNLPQGGENWENLPDMSAIPGGGRGNFTGDTTLLNQLQTQMKLLQLLQYTVSGAIILFGILTAVGVWLNKKWGRVMAVITAIIVLGYTIPTMMRTFVTLNLVEGIVKIVLAVALVVLVFILAKKPQPKTEAPVEG
ncbi:MAG TPA: hypothetical protein DD636_01195 [Anaerolineaceae bacterium]|nr:hypothetical protein [Anaerolineaceae bacterium]